MKKVQLELFEAGDHIMVTAGRNKGKVGIVRNHLTATSDVVYELADRTYEQDEDEWDDDDDLYELSPTKFLKYITKTEYETKLKKLKILTIPGLPVGVRFHGKNLIVGDNVITPANAKKLVDFITENTKGKKK